MNEIKKLYCRTFQLCFRLAMPILPYREPRILENMNQLGRLLAKKKGIRAFIVTDSGLSSLGLTKVLTDVLTKAGVPYSLYDKTVPNPTIQNVEEARDMYERHGCNVIIAFGGGSSMDCAKAVGLIIFNDISNLLIDIFLHTVYNNNKE